MLLSKNIRMLSLQIDFHLRLSNIKTYLLRKIIYPRIRLIILLHDAHSAILRPKKVWTMMMKFVGRELLER